MARQQLRKHAVLSFLVVVGGQPFHSMDWYEYLNFVDKALPPGWLQDWVLPHLTPDVTQSASSEKLMKLPNTSFFFSIGSSAEFLFLTAPINVLLLVVSFFLCFSHFGLPSFVFFLLVIGRVRWYFSCVGGRII